MIPQSLKCPKKEGRERYSLVLYDAVASRVGGCAVLRSCPRRSHAHRVWLGQASNRSVEVLAGNDQPDDDDDSGEEY